MNRPGPISTAAQVLGTLNLVLLAARIPATMFGLGWVTTALVLITGPLGILCGVVARTRERDGASRDAAGRAMLWSGATLLSHLFMLLVLGP